MTQKTTTYAYPSPSMEAQVGADGEVMMPRKTAQPPPSRESPEFFADAFPYPVDRRKPVTFQEQGKRMARFAESAGETAAECTAVCCCFPFGLADLVMTVTLKLPAGLVRKALRRRRKLRIKKDEPLWPKSRAFDDDDFSIHHGGVDDSWPSRSPSMEVSEFEKIMRTNFYGAGFWRSPSQREKQRSSITISTFEGDRKR